VHHVGRWAKGKAAESKYRNCAIQNSGFTLVNNEELYDLKTDPGETTNVIAKHPEVVAKLRAVYDQWWKDAVSLMVNENVIGPKMNPMKVLYWKQFGGGPDEAMIRKMDPDSKSDEAQPAKEQMKKKKNAEQ
jgi:arylsulfatase